MIDMSAAAEEMKSVAMNIYAYITVLVFFLQPTFQANIGNGAKYKAIMVEYRPQKTRAENIQGYQNITITAAKEMKADLIVFPEDSLTVDHMEDESLVPDPEEEVIPYMNETFANFPVIKAISQMAMENDIYVVINVRERVNCSESTQDCPARGFFLYNTDVAFDRYGTVIARYRKYNLFNFDDLDKPKAELVTFTTDFGITFGLFTCFDILFQTPVIDLVEKKNVKTMIMPNSWQGELPFFTALQIQAGWSYAMNVNLLAAGKNNPSTGNTGTGFFRARKNFFASMYEEERTVIVAGLTPTESQMMRSFDSSQGGLKLGEDATISLAEGKNLVPTNTKFRETICSNGLCCKFDVKYHKASVQNAENYTYRAVAYQGPKYYDDKHYIDVAYCAIVLCTAGNCARKPSNGNFPLIFDHIRVDADFRSTHTLQMPSTLVWKGDTSVIPILLNLLDYKAFTYETTKKNATDMVNVAIQLVKSNVGNIVTFGILGRTFN